MPTHSSRCSVVGKTAVDSARCSLRRVAEMTVGREVCTASYAPLALLTPNGLAYNFGLQACTLLGAVLYCRALGGALRVNPWAVFLSEVLFYGDTAFCCCALFGVIIGFLAW